MRTLKTPILFAMICLPALGCVQGSELEPEGELSSDFEAPSLDRLSANTANMRAIYDVPSGRASMAIDFEDERQYALVRDRLLAAGLNPATAPVVFEDLEIQRSAALAGESFRDGEEQECDMFIVTSDDEYEGDDVVFGADAVGSCFNDAPEFSFIDSCIYDADTDEVVACNVLESYGEVVDSLHTEATLEDGRRVYADGIVYSLKDGQGQVSYFLSEVFRGASVHLDMDHPTDLNGDGSIRIALERLNHGVDYDYYHSTSPADAPCNGNDMCTRDDEDLFPALNPDNPGDLDYDNSRMYIPMESSEASPILIREDGGEIFSAKAYLVLRGAGDATPAGGICLADFTDPDYTDSEGAFQVYGQLATTDQVKLGPVAMNMGKATWKEACADNRVNTALHVEVDVTSHMPGLSSEVVATAYRWDSKAFDSLQVAWGCLPEGSEILMADGGEATIESIEIGDVVVADAGGATLTVVDVTRGTETEPLVVVEDSLGHSLEMTGSHPVPLASGRVIEARSLEVGQVIETADGQAELVTVEREDFDGAVYNLVLGTADELADHEGPTTMIANGFVVGDSSMQDALMLDKDEQQRASAPEIPEGMRLQYLGSQVRNFARSL